MSYRYRCHCLRFGVSSTRRTFSVLSQSHTVGEVFGNESKNRKIMLNQISTLHFLHDETISSATQKTWKIMVCRQNRSI